MSDQIICPRVISCSNQDGPHWHLAYEGEKWSIGFRHMNTGKVVLLHMLRAKHQDVKSLHEAWLLGCKTMRESGVPELRIPNDVVAVIQSALGKSAQGDTSLN